MSRRPRGRAYPSPASIDPMTYLAPHPRGSRLAAGTLAVLLFSVNCGRVERGPSSLAGAESIVRSALPVEWQVAEVESGQIPWGHHWGEDYQGPTGQRMVLVGPRTVNVSWCAQDGTWNRSPMAREALEIWIMPGNYRDSWGSILSMPCAHPSENRPQRSQREGLWSALAPNRFSGGV